MDPLHITEFASERYFEKLRQLNDSAEQTEDVAGAVATHSLSSAVSLHQHHFTLPLGQSRQRHSNDESSYIKPSDQRKRTLGHDLTSLRSQRRPSLAGSLGNLRTRLSSQKSLATLRPHQDVCVEESHIRYM